MPYTRQQKPKRKSKPWKKKPRMSRRCKVAPKSIVQVQHRFWRMEMKGEREGRRGLRGTGGIQRAEAKLGTGCGDVS